MRKMTRSGLALTLVLGLSLAGLATAARAQGQQKAPPWTYAEYNAYQAATNEKNGAQRVKMLDDFVAKFPKSALLPYVYQVYYKTFEEQKKYEKVIEYADKLVASDSKYATDGMKLQAVYARAVAFNYTFDEKASDASAQAQKAREDAVMGLKLLGQLPKPKGMSDEKFAEQKKPYAGYFSSTEGFAALFLKDYAGAAKAFLAALNNDPKNPVTYFRLGVAYLQMAAQQASAAPAPPASTPAAGEANAAASAATQPAPLPGPSAGQSDYIKGFWALARSVALGGPTEQRVRAYLQNQMLIYQKTACQDLLTQEMKQLLMVAQTTETVDPPADYSIPSGAQLGRYLQDSNLFTIMQDLQTGGDRANFVWLAVCGNEFPEVPVKVISVAPTADGVDMQVYTGPSPKDIQAAKTANMEVKVVNQPDAQRLQKDNIVRFTGTLASYDPAPNFLLHWANAKVKEADIPPAKPGARHVAHRGRRR